MIAEFILPSDNRWLSFLKKAGHDFYHLPEYTVFSAKYEGGKPGAFYIEDQGTALLVPVLTYDLPAFLDSGAGGCDLLSAYGYPGPIFSDKVSDTQARRLFSGFVDLARQRGVVSVFLRAHPLLECASDIMAEFGTLVSHGRTVYGKMHAEHGSVWSGLSRAHKTRVNKLKRLGYVSVCNDFRYWDDFISIYQDTMSRVHAKKFYFFTKEYFNDMKRTFGDHLYFWSVISPEGDLASAAIFFETSGIVQYHLSGTAETHINMSPSKLLLYEVGNWAIDFGANYYHLGGGLGGKEDSLFKFKSSFFKNYASFFTFRMVVDEGKYDRLKREWISKFGKDGYNNDYFPLYRCPIE